MIPMWRNQATMAAACVQCQAPVEISMLNRGPVFCPQCRQRSRDRANQRARVRKGQMAIDLSRRVA